MMSSTMNQTEKAGAMMPYAIGEYLELNGSLEGVYFQALSTLKST